MHETPLENPMPQLSADLEQLQQKLAAKLARLDRLRSLRRSLARVVAVALLSALIYFHHAELRARVAMIATSLKTQSTTLKSHLGLGAAAHKGTIESAIAAAKESNAYLDSIMDMDNPPDKPVGKANSKSLGSTSTVVAASALGKAAGNEHGGLNTVMLAAKKNAELIDGIMDDDTAPKH